MSLPTRFRFESGGVSFEIAGSEEFVRRNLEILMPFVKASAGRAEPAPAAATSAGEAPAAGATGGQESVKDWYDRHAGGARLTLQDHILVFALWMRSFKKFIFTSEDIRRAFDEVGMTPPKSLLQILGVLKRDRNLILGTERRGEYMLNTTGIERARSVLGMPAPRPNARKDESAPARRDEDGADGKSAARAILGL